MDARIELDDARVIAALQRLRDAGGNTRGVMGQIARYMKTSTQLRFRAQAGPDGQKWWPSNRARKDGGQTLRDSGRLLRSLTWRASAHEAEAGTNVVYAAAHQFGIRKIISIRPHRRTTRRAPGKTGAVSVRSSPVKGHARLMFLPRRPFLGFSGQDRSRILEILRRHLAQAAGN